MGLEVKQMDILVTTPKSEIDKTKTGEKGGWNQKGWTTHLLINARGGLWTKLRCPLSGWKSTLSSRSIFMLRRRLLLTRTVNVRLMKFKGPTQRTCIRDHHGRAFLRIYFFQKYVLYNCPSSEENSLKLQARRNIGGINQKIYTAVNKLFASMQSTETYWGSWFFKRQSKRWRWKQKPTRSSR